MVSGLAIVPTVRGFKPGQGNGFSRAIKMSSTPSFGGKVKPSGPRKILSHVKTSKYEQGYFGGQIHNFLHQVLPDLLLDDSTVRIARELCWTAEDFSPLDIIIHDFHAHRLYHLGDVK
jgi:hypothetical protein